VTQRHWAKRGRRPVLVVIRLVSVTVSFLSLPGDRAMLEEIYRKPRRPSGTPPRWRRSCLSSPALTVDRMSILRCRPTAATSRDRSVP
jgi:hypothetical protein